MDQTFFSHVESQSGSKISAPAEHSPANESFSAWLNVDRHATIVDCSDALAALLETRRRELLGSSVSGWLAPRDRAVVEQLAADPVEGEHEATFITYRGDSRPARLIVNEPTHADDFQRIAVAPIHQHDGEGAFAESARMFDHLLAALPGMVYRCDDDEQWTMLYASDGCEELLGYSRARLIGGEVSYGQLIHPADRAPVREAVAAAVREHRPFEVTYRIRRSDDRMRWVWERGRAVGRKDDGTTVLAGYITDITSRLEIENSLREREATVSAMFNAIPEGIVVLDREMKVTAHNAAMSRWIGRDFVGEPGQNVTWGDTSICGEWQAREALRANEGHSRIQSVHTPDGEQRWLHIHVHPMTQPDVGTTGVVIYVRDITDTRQARRDLEESEARYRMLFEAARDAVALHPMHRQDERVTFVEVNDEMTRLVGYSRQELLTMSPLDLFSADDRASLDAAHEQLRTEGSLRLETELIGKSGQRVPIETHAQVVHLHGRAMVLSITRDMTARKRSEALLREAHDRLEHRVTERTAALRRVNEQLRREVLQRMQIQQALVAERDFAEQLLETAPCIVLVLDPDARIIRYNRFMENLCGRPMDEAVGLSWFENFLPESEQQEVRELFERCIVHPRDTSSMGKVLAGDGSVRDVEWHNRVLHDAAGQGIGIMCVGLDATDRVAAEDRSRRHLNELAHVSRLVSIGEMAAELAHELNQPLAAIVNYTRGCVRRLEEPGLDIERIREAMELSASQALRAGEIIRRLKDFARRQEPEGKPLELNALVDGMIRLNFTEARAGEVEVVQRPQEDLPPALGDRVQVEQVLLNLLRNALEAVQGRSDGPRRVTIETRGRGDAEVEVAISDTGVGVEEDAGEAIFDPFMTTKESGMGMGLAISRTIIEAHGGRLWYEPNNQVGSVFRFVLPTVNR